MISSGEIAALSRAFDAYVAFAKRLRAVADDASYFSILSGRDRMQTIAAEAEANVERFRQRRDELIEADPTDHEAILAYVEGIEAATGTRLVEAMAAEVRVTDPVRFVANVASDAASSIGSWVKTAAIVAIVVGGLYLLVNRRA